MERVKGIEPSFQAWEAHVLPLNHTRVRSLEALAFSFGACNRSLRLRSEGLNTSDVAANYQGAAAVPARQAVVSRGAD